jgi:hypothetical protein
MSRKRKMHGAEMGQQYLFRRQQFERLSLKDSVSKKELRHGGRIAADPFSNIWGILFSKDSSGQNIHTDITGEAHDMSFNAGTKEGMLAGGSCSITHTNIFGAAWNIGVNGRDGMLCDDGGREVTLRSVSALWVKSGQTEGEHSKSDNQPATHVKSRKTSS